ncbi:hypothetical protein CBS101457_005395 [Exobasidium rhododendri]|nr:hypothetical protein CBS101457_005395 [Exobasidium rhododendri]
MSRTATQKEALRTVDTDPFFDNSNISLPKPGGGKHKQAGSTRNTPPYHVGNTWKAPNGSRKDYLEATENMTAMQRHVAYFDADCDGVIWPTDTFWGFYYLGFGIILSVLSVFIVHGPFSYPTLPYRGNRFLNLLPDPYMRIYVANIHRCKHGSDSESYNRRGQFQESKFKEIIQDYSSASGKDALSFHDGAAMLNGRRNLMDFFGIFAFLFEWGSTYMLLWPKDGYMAVDDILGVLDGSIFVVLAHRFRKSRKGGAFQAK